VLKGIVIGPVPIKFVFDEDVTMDLRLDRVTVTLTKGKTLEMKFTLPDDCQIAFVLPKAGRDARGNDVPLKTPPSVTVSDPAVLSLVMPNPATPDDAASGLIVAAGPLGTAQLVVKDEDESTQPLIAIVDFEVVAGELVALADPTFGPVVKQPPAA